MGGSIGGSANKSSSRSRTSSSEDVWGPQGEALSSLYGSAGDLFSNNQGFSDQLNMIAQNLQPYMESIMGRAGGGADRMLSGGSFGDTSDIRDQLMGSIRGVDEGGSQMGKMYESIVGGAGNEYIDPMVDAMKRSSMDNLDTMQSGVGLDAAAMGQGGSSRHAMQNAMLGKDANQDMLDREMNMRGGAYDKDLAMKMGIARQADQGIQGGQDRMLRMLQGADQNVAGGMGSLSNMQNLGMGSMAPWMQAMNAPWGPMSQYADIIGGPTVLGESTGKSTSKSKGGGAQGSAGLKG